MKTQIFENYEAFLAREDKTVNGVTQAFADAHPDCHKESNNEACWGCSRCWDCSDCSGCWGCSDCSDCSGCWGCSDCSGCSGCSGCWGCSDCSDLENNAPIALVIPVIENIHSKVLEAVSKEGALEMNFWHSCNTTHCRGGWVITLAGDAGKELDRRTSSEFAAMAIYSKSSPIKVSPVRFYESNEVAMADIVRCAKEEKKMATT